LGTRHLVIVFFGFFLSSTALASPPINIKLQLSENDVLFSKDKRLSLSIIITDSKGQPFDGQPPALAASSGRLVDLKTSGQGRYTASYVMPQRRHPQAVILAAKVPDSPPAWTVLYLRAKTTLPVNTNKSNVMVTLTLGGQSYGPVRTDSSGQVSIPVEVHPSQTEARAVAVDEFGNRTIRKVEIPIPRVSLLVGFAEREVLIADGHDATDIYIIQVHSNGSPAQDVAFLVHRPQGSVSKASRIRPGLYKIKYTSPAGLKKKQTKLTVADKRNPKTSRQVFKFSLSAGQPDRLMVWTKPDTLFADGKSTSQITIKVVDRAGNSLDMHVPKISCALGKLGPLSAQGKGTFKAEYLAPVFDTGQAECLASVSRAKLPLEKKFSLQLITPIPATMDVESDSYNLVADGNNSATISILVKDKHANGLQGVDVQAYTTIGTLSRVLDDGGGRYHVIFTSPRGKRSSKVRIALTAGRGSRPPEGFVVLTLEPPPLPLKPVPWVTVGAWAGVMSNFSRMTYASFTLDSTFKLPFGSDMLYLGLESGYRFGTQDTQSLIEGIDVTTELETFPLHLSFFVKLFPRSRFSLLFGVGGGAEFVQWSVTPSLGARERNHTTLFGGLAFIGGELRLGPGALFFSLRYMYAYLIDRATVEQASGTSSSLLKGNIGGLDVGFGYRLFLW
jgi:invasin-like protein